MDSQNYLIIETGDGQSEIDNDKNVVNEENDNDKNVVNGENDNDKNVVDDKNDASNDIVNNKNDISIDIDNNKNVVDDEIITDKNVADDENNANCDIKNNINNDENTNNKIFKIQIKYSEYKTIEAIKKNLLEKCTIENAILPILDNIFKGFPYITFDDTTRTFIYLIKKAIGNNVKCNDSELKKYILYLIDTIKETFISRPIAKALNKKRLYFKGLFLHNIIDDVIKKIFIDFIVLEQDKLNNNFECTTIFENNKIQEKCVIDDNIVNENNDVQKIANNENFKIQIKHKTIEAIKKNLLEKCTIENAILPILDNIFKGLPYITFDDTTKTFIYLIKKAIGDNVKCNDSELEKYILYLIDTIKETFISSPIAKALNKNNLYFKGIFLHNIIDDVIKKIFIDFIVLEQNKCIANNIANNISNTTSEKEKSNNQNVENNKQLSQNSIVMINNNTFKIISYDEFKKCLISKCKEKVFDEIIKSKFGNEQYVINVFKLRSTVYNIKQIIETYEFNGKSDELAKYSTMLINKINEEYVPTIKENEKSIASQIETNQSEKIIEVKEKDIINDMLELLFNDFYVIRNVHCKNNVVFNIGEKSHNYDISRLENMFNRPRTRKETINDIFATMVTLVVLSLPLLFMIYFNIKF